MAVSLSVSKEIDELRRTIFKRTLDELVAGFTKSLEPPEDITISEWSDKYRRLPKASSAESGPWRTSRFPFMKEPMDEASPQSPTQEIVMMGGSQISKTESVCINPLLYYIDLQPCPILYVQKTIQTVERFSSQRLGPSLESTPSVGKKVGEMRTRDSANTKLIKTFPGGILILGGSNSAASLRSMPMQLLLLDEIDSFEMDVDNEGDPVKLAVKRTANFPRRKVIYVSTPGVKETSRIEPLFESGDQRYYHVPCPECDHYQRIVWSRIKFERDSNGDLLWVKLACEACGSLIDESKKTEMLEKGKWVARFPGRTRASFHISALYSPLGFYSWVHAVTDFLEAKKERSREKLKVWTNTVVAETWSEQGRSFESSTFDKRKEEYTADVPDGALVLTAGVDVQADRIEVEVVGWGKGGESWSIDYARFMGSVVQDEVWNDLDDYLQKTWTHSTGVQLSIACAGIDSGHEAHKVYNFCKQLEYRRIFPVKGQGGWGRGLIDRPKTRNKFGIWLFNIFVDEMKSKVYSQLEIETPGPNYAHFPRKEVYDDNYFEMLTAERLVEKRVNGQKVLLWEIRAGRRNEALDCRVYAQAALSILNPNFDAIALRGPAIGRAKPLTGRRVGVLSRGVA